MFSYDCLEVSLFGFYDAEELGFEVVFVCVVVCLFCCVESFLDDFEFFDGCLVADHGGSPLCK